MKIIIKDCITMDNTRKEVYIYKYGLELAEFVNKEKTKQKVDLDKDFYILRSFLPYENAKPVILLANHSDNMQSMTTRKLLESIYSKYPYLRTWVYNFKQEEEVKENYQCKIIGTIPIKKPINNEVYNTL